jgi:hypothetical protein
MASAHPEASRTQDWLPANPWFWLGLGGGFALWSYLWTRAFSETAHDARVIVLALGLLFGAVGVWLRWNDREMVYVRQRSMQLAAFARLGMGLIFALLALGVTLLLAMALFRSDSGGWRPGITFLLWLTLAPPFFFAAKQCLILKPDQTGLDAIEETGLSLVLLALYCLAGTGTLQLGGDFATDWDTFRLFLRVMMTVCLLGSALVVVSLRLKRLMMSLFILLHFGAIATACLSAPPSPWIAVQLWARLFRPYLEFLYLTNAYHFYAPDPNPASYLWFRLVYEAPDGKEYGWWYKLPPVDQHGRPEPGVALLYQRSIALTEGAAVPNPLPYVLTVDKFGDLHAEPSIYKHRLELTIPRALKQTKVGMPEHNEYPRIPVLDSNILPLIQQYLRPSDSSKRLLASYARFVARKFDQHPEHADWKFKNVKIYRVIHQIAPAMSLHGGLPPNDPELYLPYYMGTYEADGKLAASGYGDPYLYWLLPIMRENRNDPFSRIRDFARFHANDPNWVRPAVLHGQLRNPPPWGEPEARDQELVKP